MSTPEVSERSAVVEIKTTFANISDQSGKVTLRSAVVGPDGKPLATARLEITLAAGKDGDVSQRIEISRPQLWGLNTPHLHRLVTRVYAGETVLDGSPRTP